MGHYADMMYDRMIKPDRPVPKTDFEILAEKNIAIKNYRDTTVDLLQLAFPNLSYTELEYAVDRSIAENLRKHPATIDNSYKKTKVAIDLPELANYILSREPIITTYGTLFTKHGDVPHPLYKMIDSFIWDRDKNKKEMFKYPKGSFDYQKYNLLQLLLKIDANAFYGSLGMSSCFYYNFYTAASITAVGRSLNSAMALFFESFLANNVPFESLNELVVFIHNICNDKYELDDRVYINHNATVAETFAKIMTSCGFNYIPSWEDMDLVWRMLSQLSQLELNRLYYKNNLYEFCDNNYVTTLLITILRKLNEVWTDSNSIPEEVHDEVIEFTNLLREYVYYSHQIIDRTDKMEALIRSVSIIQDTDSAIVSYDAWYQYLLQKTIGVPMKIKETEYNWATEKTTPITYTITEYDFVDDDLIEKKRLRNPIVVIPQDQLRHSILSILSYSISYLLNDYMYQYCKNSHALLPENENYPMPKGFSCMIHAKTEFLFKRLLLTDAKKHYASYQELQEGNKVPKDEALDTKGMDAFNKSTTNDTIKERLKAVLVNEIMDTPTINQVAVVKAIAMIEKEIYNSIQSGKKEFYKPAKVKSKSAYADPMRIQGIKASIAYNALHQEGTESIDLDDRNSVDIVKVLIDKHTIERIKDTYPDVYEKGVAFLEGNQYYKDGIDSIAIPTNEPVPRWVLEFVRYEEIITDNVGKFPMESIGLFRGNDSNNKSNLVQF